MLSPWSSPAPSSPLLSPHRWAGFPRRTWRRRACSDRGRGRWKSSSARSQQLQPEHTVPVLDTSQDCPCSPPTFPSLPRLPPFRVQKIAGLWDGAGRAAAPGEPRSPRMDRAQRLWGALRAGGAAPLCCQGGLKATLGMVVGGSGRRFCAWVRVLGGSGGRSPCQITRVVPQVRILAVAMGSTVLWPGPGWGHLAWEEERAVTIVTLRCRLEVDLQASQEGKEPFWHPQAHFLYSHLSPTSLAVGRAVPREQTGPTGEQEVSVHCRTGDVLHTRVSEASKAPGPCRGCIPGSVLPLLAAGPPSQADFPCSCDKSHLVSSGPTHLNKGYGIKS